MSSLAGALLSPEIAVDEKPVLLENSLSIPGDTVPEDVEMQPLNTQPEQRVAEPEDQDEEMDDLFGNDNNLEEAKPSHHSPSPAASQQGSERLPSPVRKHREALEYGEDDHEPAGVIEEVKEADVAFPNIPVPKSSDGDNWVIRMPNFVKVDSKFYHPDTYMGPEHDDEESQQAETLREKSMTIKLKVENTVRWRWVKDENGQDRRQSNSRIIRWSDGTLSLRLGKELFDINQSIDTSGAMPRQSIGPQASQSQPPSQPAASQSSTSSKLQGLTYLVAQHKRAQVLQSEALVTGYMTLRPTGMQSETHRMLVRAVGQKHNKVARLRMAPDPTMDPEREVQELMKQSAKKSKKKADTEDGLGGGRRRRTGHSRKRAGHDVWSDDDEDEGGHHYAASDDDEDDAGPSPRRGKRKAADDEKKGGDYQEDDFVVADSSDEDAGSDSGKKRRKGADGDEEMEEDPLDRLDAKIMEQEELNKRRQKNDSGGKVVAAEEEDAEGEVEEKDPEPDMDVESEEDEEDEAKVRRVGAGSRKKRALDLDDDDDDE